MYNAEGEAQRDKLIVSTSDTDNDVEEQQGNESESQQGNQGNSVHVARPEDGTELIDEDPEENESVGETDQEVDAQNITEEKKKKFPFKDLVVYVWKSWKIIIGEQLIVSN